MNSMFTSLILINHAIASIYDHEARVRLMSAVFGISMMKPEEGKNIAKDAESRQGYL